jgi:4-alpha-glucanotransferase
MTAEEQSQSLEALAEAFGVTRSYHDGTGRLRRASDDALLAVLRALGAPVEHLHDCADALRALRDPALPPSPPTRICAVEGRGAAVAFPPGPQRPRAAARLRLECGEIVDVRIESPGEDRARVRIPHDVPAGYHVLAIEEGDRAYRVEVCVAPARLPEAPMAWGLFAPLYGLREARPGRRDMATYGDLAVLGRWMSSARERSRRHRDASFLGLLPLLACYFEEPFEPSPYSPISRAFWSELYVDSAAAPEFADSPDAQRALEAHARGHADAASRIDYRLSMQQRRVEIEALRQALDRTSGTRREAFERCLEEDGDLASYAAFRAAVERYGSTWERWPQRARHGSLRAGADYDGEAFRTHAYAQWLAREQFARAAGDCPTGLYLDLPLGSHGGGYDTWRYAAEHVSGVALGAPPDDVFDGGQNWGFPPLHPERAAAGGYAPLRAALRHHCEHAALLRIDHVMGLHRAFWIPQGYSAADGVYVRMPAEDLWSVLAIEAARGRGGRGTAVVGEDLGTVPPEVRRQMHDRGALRLHVLPFECSGEGGTPNPPARESLACLGTHDMEPLATWWSSPGCPRERLQALLGCGSEAESALPALLEWLCASDATVVLASLEDLWLEPERQNLPGTSAGERNWQRPFAFSFARFAADPAIAALLDRLRGTGESPEAPR